MFFARGFASFAPSRLHESPATQLFRGARPAVAQDAAKLAGDFDDAGGHVRIVRENEESALEFHNHRASSRRSRSTDNSMA